MINAWVVGENVMVKVAKEEGERVSAGGIILAGDAEDAILVGEVLSVGTDEKVRGSISEENTVWFPKFKATRLKIDGQTVYIIPWSSILAVK